MEAEFADWPGREPVGAEMVDGAHPHTFLALTWCRWACVLALLLRITSWPVVASL